MAVHTSRESRRKPLLSVVVPVLDAERTLEETLVHLFGGTSLNGSRIPGSKYPKNKLEVLLVDGGSSDRTPEILRRWQKAERGVRVIQIPGCKSPGQARNAALKVARGEYILFLDADCAPDPEWAGRMLEPFLSDPGIGMVGGEIRTLQFDPRNKVEHYCEQVGFLSVGDRVGMKGGGYYPPVRKGLPREVNGTKTCPYFSTSNSAVSRKAARAIGNHFWDESGSEDVDFSLRVSKAGYKLYFQPGAVVHHMHRANLREFGRQVAGSGYGRPLAIRNHARRVLEIRFQYLGGWSWVIPWPWQAMIYLGDFHFLHLAGLGAAVETLRLSLREGLGLALVSRPVLFLWILFAFFLVRYFFPVLRIQPMSDFLFWCWVRYRSNLALFLGGLRGAFKYRRLYIDHSW